MLAESRDDPKAALSAYLINRHFIKYAAKTVLVSLLHDKAEEQRLHFLSAQSVVRSQTNTAEKPV